ncbi:SAV_915 family protein [Streptomyces fildesensis]|uniref:SAV_915 family protein n=1 Tax=Streptomyces fildesensis TaxID=375757 RepID=A0ABW8C5R1_9ACTN
MGCTARIFRTPLGGRTAVGFTTEQQLIATLGDDQQWVRLAEPALRALTAPLGVTALTVDPQFTAPAASAPTPTAPLSADTSGSWRSWDPQSVGVLRVAGIAAVVSCVNLLIG